MINGTGSKILRRKVVSPSGRHLVAGVTVFRLCKTDLPKNVQNVRNIILCVFCFLFGQFVTVFRLCKADHPKNEKSYVQNVRNLILCFFLLNFALFFFIICDSLQTLQDRPPRNEQKCNFSASVCSIFFDNGE